MKMHGGVEVLHHTFLTLALDGEWPDSYPGHFTTRERAPITHRIGNWAGHRVSLDTVEKRKILCPSQKFPGCKKDDHKQKKLLQQIPIVRLNFLTFKSLCEMN
jgi:hypothetical protein